MNGEGGWNRQGRLTPLGEGFPLGPAEPRTPAAPSRLRRIARVALRAEARQLFLHDCLRSVAGEPALPAAPIRAIAVVCKGNICRSPFAAALLARMRPDLLVTSYGLAAADGEPADARARALAREWSCDLDSHGTRALGADGASAADLILTMDAVQSRAIVRLLPSLRERVRSLGDFLPNRPFAIADPWSESESVWRETYARVAQALERLAARLGEHPW